MRFNFQLRGQEGRYPDVIERIALYYGDEGYTAITVIQVSCVVRVGERTG
jgi:hypothetical protein